MSFDWNLSSDEENDFDDWAAPSSERKEPAALKLHAAASRPFHDHAGEEGESSSSDEEEDVALQTSSFKGVAFSRNFDEEGDDDDADEVDWEDAGDNQTMAATNETPELATDTNAAATVPAIRPVTLDWTKQEKDQNSSKKSSKRMARKMYRFEHLTPDLQYLLSNLEKSHLLSLTAHAMYASRQCSQEDNLHVAHSLIPLAWVRAPISAPTMDDLKSFCNFFFHLVHPWRHQMAEEVAYRPRYRKRRKQATDTKQEISFRGKFIQYRTPLYCKFLADRAAAPPGTALPHHDFHSHDHVHLFVSMARSLGWRVRYVTALEPCKRDLDIDHPLFVTMSTRNVFQRLWKQTKRSKKDNGDQERSAKRLKPHKLSDAVPSATTSSETSGDTGLEKALSMFMPSLTKQEPPTCWVEILSQTPSTTKNGKNTKLRWVHLDASRELIDTPDAVETILYASEAGIPFSKSKKKRAIAYALAAEHVSMADGSLKHRLVDVTPRYASSFVESLKVRGVVRGKQGPLADADRSDKWWAATLKSVNMASHSRREDLKAKGKGKTKSDAIALDTISENDDNDKKPAALVDHNWNEVDEHEQQQLHESRQNEPIPTSKTAFKTNPIYTLPSLLNSNEVLKPDAKKRVCGVFKGEFVFRRSEVETAFPANKWLYKGRKVKECELNKPIKRVKARNRGPSKNFKALKSYGVGKVNDGSEETREKILDAASKPLDDGMENLYASWQTNPWSPGPVGPSDPLPANEHNNIELALINPGLVHIDERYVAKVAKKLGIPYVPCLLGFEGHGGNRTPTIRGIVVHQHNEELLREAHEEMASHFLQEEHENRQRAILLRWKRLMVGVLTKERLDRTYG